MLLDTLHEDVPLPLNGDCRKEGDESTNQIPDDIESHGPIEVDMKDGLSSLCAMTSVISETFQGMLRSEVGYIIMMSSLNYRLHHNDVI